MAKRLRAARKQLPQAEIELAQLERPKDYEWSKAEEKLYAKLVGKLEDLEDTDIFLPLYMKVFRQFRELIRILGLSYLVTIFEGYLADIIKEILLTHPDTLKSAKQLTAEEVLSFRDRNELVSYLAEKEVEGLLYKPFSAVVEYFNEKFKIDLNTSGVTAEEIIEILATRDIHIHNRGLVSRLYLRKVKGTKLKAGAYRSITPEYLKTAFDKVDTLVSFIDDKAKERYFPT